MSKRPPLRILDASGSPEAIGHAHGSAFADEIRAYTAERVEIVCNGSWAGQGFGRADVLDLAESMLPAHEAFDPAVHAEMLAMASAAGITPAEAVIVGGFTDFVDAARAVVGGPIPAELQEDDCTAVIVPDHRAGGSGFLAQTWDMHASATDHVLLLRLAPDDAPNALVFTTTGCVGQIGMNSEGVAVGINDIPGLDGTRGVTWVNVVRSMLRCSTADEALQVLLGANLAGAHNYLIFDRHGVGYDVEAMPSVRPFTKLDGDVLVHTNHAIDPDAAAVQAEKEAELADGSARRLARAGELLADGDVDTDRLVSVLRDPEAICRRSCAPYHIESSGATIMRPGTGEFHACWGIPADNEFVPVAMPT